MYGNSPLSTAWLTRLAHEPTALISDFMGILGFHIQVLCTTRRRPRADTPVFGRASPAFGAKAFEALNTPYRLDLGVVHNPNPDDV